MSASRSLANCFHMTRFVILSLAILCMSAVLGNSLLLNFTIICMKTEVPINASINSSIDFDDYVDSAERDLLYREIPMFPTFQQGYLFSAVAIGNIIGLPVLTTLTARVGTRIAFTGFGLISGIATLVAPLAAETGFWPMFIVRMIQGFGTAICMPAIGSITHAWSSVDGSATFISLLTCHIQFANIVIMPTSGVLCESSYGWEMIYYLMGVCTIMSFIVFYSFYRNDPSNHGCVSKAELAQIMEGKIVAVVPKHKVKVPYAAMIVDPPVIGALVSTFGRYAAFMMFIMYGPTYLNKVLGMDIGKTGWAAAIPFIGSIIVKVLAGPLSDAATCLSVKGRVILFTTVSQACMSICIVVLALLPRGYQLAGQIAYTLTVVFCGLNAVGTIQGAQMMARQHSHIMMSAFGFLNSVIMLTLPLVVSIIAPHNSKKEWTIIFYSLAVILVITTIIYDLTCETDPRPWTYDPYHRESTSQVFAEENPSKKSSRKSSIDTPVYTITVPEKSSLEDISRSSNLTKIDNV
uniref:MFS domain-containing protein n=1 Tax=Panagrellus redivivus TaxID=6233 RepID=A0A7E4VRJ8_PANRE